jgi:co-chaperonin GroES (HSP10)
MEITDKRKFTEEGELREDAVIAPKPFQLIEIPCVYDDPAPMGNNILVRQGAAETVYSGTRFVIPETAQQSPNDGVVVAVGPEVNQVVPGDLVTFGKFNAEPISVDGETYQLVSIYDVKLRRKVTYAVNA